MCTLTLCFRAAMRFCNRIIQAAEEKLNVHTSLDTD